MSEREVYDAGFVRRLVAITALLGVLLGATTALLYALGRDDESRKAGAVAGGDVALALIHHQQQQQLGLGASGGAHVQRLPGRNPTAQSQVVVVTDAPARPPFRTYRTQRDGNTEFEQVGTLTSADRQTRAGLYGRPSPTHSGRWQYFARTATAGDVSMGIKSSPGGRDCLENMGCDELYGGETVSVPELSADPMTVGVYRTAPIF